ncbi:MAG TPA: CHAD domain-containing protein [Acidobacteriaceae bacterium]|nr:CHAD domain-containing protein [Acidobacteriaceae bacterium]
MLQFDACHIRPASIMTASSSGLIFSALAEEQADKAVRSLAQRRNRHNAIHATRKAIRRLRSILSLCHQALDPEASAIDRGLRRVASSLSGLRDAHAVSATASQLAEGIDRDLWLDVAARLEARRDALLVDEMSKDPKFVKRCARLSALASAVVALPWQRLSKRYLEEGMARSTRRVAKAKRAFEQEPNPANRHRWRRRVRRLRMQTQMIQAASRAAPSLLGFRRDYSCTSVQALNRLSDRLAKTQDLRMLQRSLIVLDKDLPLPRLRRRIRAEVNFASV